MKQTILNKAEGIPTVIKSTVEEDILVISADGRKPVKVCYEGKSLKECDHKDLLKDVKIGFYTVN